MIPLKHIAAMVVIGWCISLKPAHGQWGIGIQGPQAKVHIHDGTLLSITPKLPPETSPFYAPAFNDDDSVQHAFKWMHDKAAVRFLGKGFYSVGIDTLNSGKFSCTAGYDNIARGMAASSFGLRAYAEQTGSFASGCVVISGYHLTFAQGYSTIASGPNCVSIGTNLENNYQVGSFIFGHSDFNAQSTSNNQFKAVFIGGYEFYSNAATTVGVILSAGNNAWTVVSDVRKKENFLPAQGNRFLKSISKMPLTSWNYKGQDPKQFRHYGPMAQDFFKAFGKDALGTIGSDTMINQADLDGVTLVAIRQLIYETDALERANDVLAAELATLRAKLLAVKEQPMKPYEKASYARK